MKLDAADLELFAAAADLLIPAGDGMPSASEAGVAQPGLHAVLESRPELEPVLASLLRPARGQNAKEFLAHLKNSDAAGFGAFAEAVAGAYFMNPEVRTALGYNGQKALPIDEQEQIDPRLLEPVLDRGAIYRPTGSGNRLASG
jgi:hypothetical protein